MMRMRMRRILFFALGVMVLCSAVCGFNVDSEDTNNNSNNDETDNNTFGFVLEHAFGDSKFSPRSDVTIAFSRRTRTASVTFSDGKLDEESTKRLRALVANNGYYRLRLVSRSTGEANVVSSVKACALFDSGFREAMVFHSDIYGSVLALDYRTPLTTCTRSLSHFPSPTISLKTKSKVTLGRPGEKARDTTDLERKAKLAQEAASQEKGFFGKYWMYLVPVGLFILLQMAAPPQGDEAK